MIVPLQGTQCKRSLSRKGVDLNANRNVLLFFFIKVLCLFLFNNHVYKTYHFGVLTKFLPFFVFVSYIHFSIVTFSL